MFRICQWKVKTEIILQKIGNIHGRLFVRHSLDSMYLILILTSNEFVHLFQRACWFTLWLVEGAKKCGPFYGEAKLRAEGV